LLFCSPPRSAPIARPTQRHVAGFTLVELLIVVAITGILAAIALPDFTRIQVIARMAEARASLKGIYSAQQIYYLENQSFGCGFVGSASPCSSIGFSPDRGNRYALSLNPVPTHWQDRTTNKLYSPDAGTVFDGIEGDAYALKNQFSMGGNVSATGQQVVGLGSVDAVTFNPGHGVTAPPAMPGVTTGQKGSFAAVACGNIDAERTGIDKWFIGSLQTVVTAGHCVTSGLVVPAGVPGRLYNDVSCDN